MINKSNMEETKEKYMQFWNQENHDRPLIYATAPKAQPKIQLPAFAGTNKERWLDIDYQIAHARSKMNATYYGGDSYPYIGPDLGPDIFGAMLGCDLAFGETTSWAIHNIVDWNEEKPFVLDKENPWFKAISNLVDAFVEDAKDGDYLVGIPDFHPGLDGLTSLRGPQELCYDLYDETEIILDRITSMFEIYKEVFELFYKKTTKYQQGCTHWMNPWHPGRFYNVSCDFMCMLSPDMFEEFVAGEIRKEARLYDTCMFHLDGPDAAKHLDALLEMKEITGIQWQYGAGNPTAAHWIPMMQKIQEAGKNIIVDVVPKDIEDMCKYLKPEGLMMNAYCTSESEARSVVAQVIRS